MKFKCPPTKEQRIAAHNAAVVEEFKRVITQRTPTKVFCWFPKRLKNGQCAWLEHVFAMPIKAKIWYDAFDRKQIQIDTSCGQRLSWSEEYCLKLVAALTWTMHSLHVEHEYEAIK